MPIQARFEGSKEGENLTAPKASLHEHLAIRTNAVDLEPVLGEIETNGGNLHGGRLLSCVALLDDHVVAHSMPGAGAVHPIKNISGACRCKP
jgi:hypothetical protein